MMPRQMDQIPTAAGKDFCMRCDSRRQDFSAYIICMPFFTAIILLKRARSMISHLGGVTIRSLLTVSSPLRRKDGGQALQGGP
jgi:hypothetical protein